jgi:hypothetical protein
LVFIKGFFCGSKIFEIAFPPALVANHDRPMNGKTFFWLYYVRVGFGRETARASVNSTGHLKRHFD